MHNYKESKRRKYWKYVNLETAQEPGKKKEKKNMLDNLEFEEGNSFFAEATWMNGTTWEVHVCFLLQ